VTCFYIVVVNRSALCMTDFQNTKFFSSVLPSCNMKIKRQILLLFANFIVSSNGKIFWLKVVDMIRSVFTLAFVEKGLKQGSWHTPVTVASWLPVVQLVSMALGCIPWPGIQYYKSPRSARATASASIIAAPR